MVNATSVRGLLFAGALVMGTADLTAQSSDSAAAAIHRNECRLAEQVLRTGHPAPRLGWAREKILTCREEGPAHLAGEWHRVDADTADVLELVHQSSLLRDVRLYEALVAVAGDGAELDVVRVGAMLSLARLANPRNAVWFAQVRPRGDGRVRIPAGAGPSLPQRYGTSPLGDVSERTLALFREIGARRSTEPAAVWYAAAALALNLEHAIESGIQVPPPDQGPR